MNRAVIVTIALAVLASACGKESSTPITTEEARNALPSSDQARIDAPAASATSALVARTGSDAVVALRADFADDTFILATSVNFGVVTLLDVMGAIARLVPPTSCAADTCTWGPGASTKDKLEYQLTVIKQDANDYTWAFQGRAIGSSANFTDLLKGEAFTTAQVHVGHGTMHADFDAAAALQQVGSDAGTGTVDVSYKNDDPTVPRTLSVDFRGTASGRSGQKANASYVYSDGSAGGDVQLASRNLSTQETLQLHTRWVANGSGRGDAKFTQGSTTVTRSECWGGLLAGFPLGYESTGGVVDPSFADLTTCGTFTEAVLPSIPVP